MNYHRYIYLDNNHILHSLGLIINLNNLKMTYSTNNHNYIYFNKKKMYFPNLIFKSFYKIKSITKRNIIHLDSNIFNNSFDNLYYERSLKNKNKNIKYNNYRIHYLIFINKYDLEYKKIKTYNSIKYINILNIKNFIIQLLNNEYVYHDYYYWNLEIKQIELQNLDNYTKLIDNIYYISNDLSHIINSFSNHILQIHINPSNGEHYSNIYIKNNKLIKIKLEYYTNPDLYRLDNSDKKNDELDNSDKLLDNSDKLLYNSDKLLYNSDKLFKEFETDYILYYDNIFNETDIYDLDNTYINALNEFLVKQL